MNKFAFVDCPTVDQALDQLGDGATVKAGGIDLLDLMKDGIVSPPKLVNIRNVSSLRGITSDGDGLHLGPLSTLSEIATIRRSKKATQHWQMLPATPPRRRCAIWQRLAAISCSAHAAGTFAPATSTAKRRAAPATTVTRTPAKTNTTPSLTMVRARWCIPPRRQCRYSQ